MAGFRWTCPVCGKLITKRHTKYSHMYHHCYRLADEVRKVEVGNKYFLVFVVDGEEYVGVTDAFEAIVRKKVHKRRLEERIEELSLVFIESLREAVRRKRPRGNLISVKPRELEGPFKRLGLKERALVYRHIVPKIPGLVEVKWEHYGNRHWGVRYILFKTKPLLKFLNLKN